LENGELVRKERGSDIISEGRCLVPVDMGAVTLGERGPPFMKSLGVIFSEGCTAKKIVRILCEVRCITIPFSVEMIEERCFIGCERLSEVNFAEESQLIVIGAKAFSGCPLWRIVIPDSVESLGDSCFYDCKYLSEVIFGNHGRIKTIGNECFANCGLKRVVIPGSMEIIEDHCFAIINQGPGTRVSSALCEFTFAENSHLQRIG
jgi:hypothetical protein